MMFTEQEIENWMVKLVEDELERLELQDVRVNKPLKVDLETYFVSAEYKADVTKNGFLRCKVRLYAEVRQDLNTMTFDWFTRGGLRSLKNTTVNRESVRTKGKGSRSPATEMTPCSLSRTLED